MAAQEACCLRQKGLRHGILLERLLIGRATLRWIPDSRAALNSGSHPTHVVPDRAFNLQSGGYNGCLLTALIHGMSVFKYFGWLPEAHIPFLNAAPAKANLQNPEGHLLLLQKEIHREFLQIGGPVWCSYTRDPIIVIVVVVIASSYQMPLIVGNCHSRVHLLCGLS